MGIRHKLEELPPAGVVGRPDGPSERLGREEWEERSGDGNGGDVSESLIKKLDSVGQIARLITPLGVLALLVLQTQFVGRTEFATGMERIKKVEEVLIRMEAQAATDLRHDAVLSDHELRLRALSDKLK